MSGYDPDERIHPPAPSFLSRPPNRAERRRLRRLLAAMPPAPELVFWPESIPIDGPWSTGPMDGTVTGATGATRAMDGAQTGATGAMDGAQTGATRTTESTVAGATGTTHGTATGATGRTHRAAIGATGRTDRPLHRRHRPELRDRHGRHRPARAATDRHLR